MLKKQKFVLVAGCVMAAVFLTFPQSAEANLHDDVAALIEHVRKQEVADDSELRTYPPREILIELKKYLSDPDWRVRMAVLGQVVGVAQRNPADLQIRQQITGFLVAVAKTDPEGSIAGYAAGIPYTFPPYFVQADFTDAMRRDILQLVSQPYPRHEFILLAGVANVQDAKERLWKLAKKDRRTAYLALARMGDEAAIDHVITEFEAFRVNDMQTEITKVTRQLKDVAFIRQPEAVEILIRYLLSEDYLPNSKDQSKPGTMHASRALDLLAQIIKDFPIKGVGPSYSDVEIQKAREWITAHRNALNIKR